MNNKMAINTIYQQLNLNSKVNKQAEQKQNNRYRECFDSCHNGREVENGLKKVNELSTN